MFTAISRVISSFFPKDHSLGVWEFAKKTHLGGRSGQQDRTEIFNAQDGDPALLVLADGMGGHSGGALAAEAVIESAEEAWGSLSLASSDLPGGFLAATCANAHERIGKISRQQRVSPMSTCVFLYLRENIALWAHVGDSRLYHVRKGKILFRTRDHSVVQMLVDKGQIQEREMGGHRDQSRLLQALGSENGAVPDFGSARLKWGDTFLLCSDGLWEVFSPEEIEAWTRRGFDPEAVERWMEEAVRRGGEDGDNVSFILAKWNPRPS